ncbi:hypothetical protein BC828DRAFT_376465 [Blastocladiella britannica]|nr:hypothetical protein BC828DRAFT_376465 [Blastocladiella britannica]
MAPSAAVSTPGWARWTTLGLALTAASLYAIYRSFPVTAEERTQEILELLENVQLSVQERLNLIEELQSFQLTPTLARTLLRKCTNKSTHPEVQSTLMAVLCTFSEQESNAPVLLGANALDHLLSVLESDIALQATYLSAATAVYDLVHGNPAAKKRVIEAGVARAVHRRLSSRAHSELTELLLTLSVRLLISYDSNMVFVRAGVLGDVVRVFSKTKRRSIKERCLNLIAIMSTFLTASADGVSNVAHSFAKYKIEREIIMIIHFDEPINTPWCLLILKNLLLLDLIHIDHAAYPSLFSDLLRVSGLNEDLRVIAGHILILLLHHDPSFTDALTTALPIVIEDIIEVVSTTDAKMVFLELVLFGLEHHAAPLINQYRVDLRELAEYCAATADPRAEDDPMRGMARKIELALDEHSAEIEAHVAIDAATGYSAAAGASSAASSAVDDRSSALSAAGSTTAAKRRAAHAAASGGGTSRRRDRSRGRMQRAKDAALRVFRSSRSRGRQAVPSPQMHGMSLAATAGSSSRSPSPAPSRAYQLQQPVVRGIVVLDDAPPVPPLPSDKHMAALAAAAAGDGGRRDPAEEVDEWENV